MNSEIMFRLSWNRFVCHVCLRYLMVLVFFLRYIFLIWLTVQESLCFLFLRQLSYYSFSVYDHKIKLSFTEHDHFIPRLLWECILNCVRVLLTLHHCFSTRLYWLFPLRASVCLSEYMWVRMANEFLANVSKAEISDADSK